VALADATSNSTFGINHYFGERKAHEEGSSCFLRRRQWVHQDGYRLMLRRDKAAAQGW
jgi:hypothetical protein